MNTRVSCSNDARVMARHSLFQHTRQYMRTGAPLLSEVVEDGGLFSPLEVYAFTAAEHYFCGTPHSKGDVCRFVRAFMRAYCVPLGE